VSLVHDMVPGGQVLEQPLEHVDRQVVDVLAPPFLAVLVGDEDERLAEAVRKGIVG
jgi:hypothetical protein